MPIDPSRDRRAYQAVVSDADAERDLIIDMVLDRLEQAEHESAHSR